MSDFISGLRGDLVGAAERERRRGALGRAAGTARRAAPTRRTLAGAVALALGAAALAIAIAALAPSPADRPARLRVVASIRIGGQPSDGSLGAGALWVADFSGRVVRIDPATRRVGARIPVRGQPEVVAASGDAVWVRAANRGSGASEQLLRVAPRSSRVGLRAPIDPGTGLAVGDGAVWLVRRFTEPRSPESIDRLDPVTGRRTDRTGVRNVDGVAAAGGVVWAVVHDGTVVRIDARTGRVLRRWPQLAPLADAATTAIHSMVADAGGVWVLSTRDAQILRIEGARVVRRIPVDATAQPMLARTGDGFLWIAAGGGVRAPNVVERIDSETGAVTARVGIGTQRPVAIAAAGATLWAFTGTGRALAIGP